MDGKGQSNQPPQPPAAGRPVSKGCPVLRGVSVQAWASPPPTPATQPGLLSARSELSGCVWTSLSQDTRRCWPGGMGLHSWKHLVWIVGWKHQPGSEGICDLILGRKTENSAGRGLAPQTAGAGLQGLGRRGGLRGVPQMVCACP